MFNVGFAEIFILLVLGLIILGPEQFPKIARVFLQTLNDLRKVFREVKKETEDIQSEVREIISAEDSSKKKIEEKKND